MNEDIALETIEWRSYEYKHKEKSIDFLWGIGIVSVILFVLAIWFKNYIFGIFILVSGGLLIMFGIKHPEEVSYKIDSDGLTIGKDTYTWKKVKGFSIKKYEDDAKLLVELDKYFLPVYTIHMPLEIEQKVKQNIKKIVEQKELRESQSMLFMEKIGF